MTLIDRISEEHRPVIVHMIGNAHIDPVWMWGWQAGADEVLATFRSAADRCDEYPEFIFTRGEAWTYQLVERLDPELFARVKTMTDRGQWHITGGMYIQPDSNLPTETGWRRQFIHGHCYFRDRFGIEPRVAFNVDSFGHPATLPDILASEGMDAYVFHRPHESQVHLPATTFRWRGTGGAEVTGFRIAPVYVTRTDDLWGQITVALEAADPALGHTMCFYGVGNHGGGPTKGSIEYILANHDAFPGHELRFSTPAAFFAAIADKRDALPVVDDELQHTFPGCYSVMHDIKQKQRFGELLLTRAEQAANTFSPETERSDLMAHVDRAWDDLLFTQFHDVLSGTSIPSAWDSIRAMQGRAWIEAEEAVYAATRRWAQRHLPGAGHQQIALVNPEAEDWSGLVEFEPWLEFDLWRERWLSTPDGESIDFQLVQPEAQQGVSRVIFPATVPAGGALQVLVRDDAPPTRTPASDLTGSETHLANSHLRIELSAAGIAGIFANGTTLLGPDGITLHIREDHTDTWTFPTDRFIEPVATVFEPGTWTVEETGPLRARVRAEGWLGHSWIRWTLSLHRDDPRPRMEIEVNFSERHKALQLAVQLAQAPSRWTDGLAGGSVDREASVVEWPMLGWSRVEFGTQALAILTHDAYSLSLNDDRWQWTLLRSPRMSWGGGNPEVYTGRDWHTDQGPHRFRFLLHPGAPDDAASLAIEARQFAMPPVTFDRYEGLNRQPWGAQAPRRLWTGAEQRAEKSGKLPLPIDDRGADPFTEMNLE